MRVVFQSCFRITQPIDKFLKLSFIFRPLSKSFIDTLFDVLNCRYEFIKVKPEMKKKDYLISLDFYHYLIFERSLSIASFTFSGIFSSSIELIYFWILSNTRSPSFICFCISEIFSSLVSRACLLPV